MGFSHDAQLRLKSMSGVQPIATKYGEAFRVVANSDGRRSKAAQSAFLAPHGADQTCSGVICTSVDMICGCKDLSSDPGPELGTPTLFT
jgi:hypothetical protein